MTYSLNEIEALAKKAARGGGYDWGVAEEAGKAVRWLASHDLPGAELLAAHLSLHGHDGPPQTLDGDWSSATGALCPLTAGITLNDCANHLSAGQTMRNVTQPLLLVPFAAWAAIHIGQPVRVAWENLRIDTDGAALWIDGPRQEITADQATDLTCQLAPTRTDTPLHPRLRGTVAPETWRALDTFAQRTFAPATEASRLLGAGAGLSDND